MTEKLIFAFDLGSGSLGECVRQRDQILHLNSLLIDHEFASITEQAAQRRAFRTRQAHLAREHWWQQTARQAGLEVLCSSQPSFETPACQPDPRLLREFAAPGDQTLYTSCLLRIALLQGQPLQSWQIYKAVWSALQHRGYDAQLPWKSEVRLIEEKIKNNEKLTPREEKLLKEFQEEAASSNLYLQEVQQFPEAYQLPCYFEAYRLGLWDYQQPQRFKTSLSAAPQAARNKEGGKTLIAPRKLVEKELRTLLEQAAKQYPGLQGKTDFILYGPAEKPYAPYTNPKQYAAYRGTDWEWQGILAQKTPRFDNRALANCRLIPRFHVCKAQTPLNLQICFLLALKNMRYTKGKNTSCALTCNELASIYHAYLPNLEKYSANVIGVKDWKKEVTQLGGIVNENQKAVPAPSKSGRSRFSRPAMEILQELILSGQNPHDFYHQKTAQLTNTNPLHGLIKEDFAFLLAMPNSWDKIHIPDTREADKKLSPAERKEAISSLLSGITHPVVRHRLFFLWQRMAVLEAKYGTPDEVIFEIVREDFLSPEEKEKLIKFQKTQSALHKKLAKEAGLKNVLKMRLFMDQKGIDLYDTTENRALSATQLDEYDIDHIVPQSRGGADSYANKVLTKRSLNIAKSNRTPYEWLSGDSAVWSAFLSNLKEANLSDRKFELLTSNQAAELEQRRNDLQATAYVEKLAQYIAALHFGWGYNTKNDQRRLFAASGAQTARIRRAFKLDQLLYSAEEFKKALDENTLSEKNRKNKKHHALDALVLSLIRDIKYDEKTHLLQAPSFFTPPFCTKALNRVYPQTVKACKPKLRDTIYGLRERVENGTKYYYLVTRYKSTVSGLQKLEEAKKQVKNIFDPVIRKELQQYLDRPDITPETWQAWLNNWSDNGKKIRKITKIESGPYTEKDIVIKKGRRQIGCFYELGKMKGQFLTNKEKHKGQIIYRNPKAKWKVDPVYLWDSLPAKLAEAKQKYGNILFLKSGQLIEIQHDVGKVKKGIYRMCSLNAAGQFELENIHTQESYHPRLTKIMEIGKLKPFNP